jgi:hypothetical protein
MGKYISPAMSTRIARHFRNLKYFAFLGPLEITASMAFQKLVRCQVDGETFFGDLLESTSTGHKVRKLQGDVFGNLEKTDKTFSVLKVRHA